VFNASAKSTSLGTFAHNLLSIFFCAYSTENVLKDLTENDYKEWLSNMTFNGDDDECTNDDAVILS